MNFTPLPIEEAVVTLVAAADERRRGPRNLQMSGDPHYQPKPLRPYLGYDQRAGWQIIVSWYWMVALAIHDIMPSYVAKALTPELLRRLVSGIRTTEVKALEDAKTHHDVQALLMLMRRICHRRSTDGYISV